MGFILIVIIAVVGVLIAVEQTPQSGEYLQNISVNNTSQDNPNVNYSEIDVQMKSYGTDGGIIQNIVIILIKQIMYN
ncbi:hypothetical protein [uncultured Methanobrevibacter sp.]|uniref:hypothetical protein n=1 Tax=uncultured Methanobrevibacter sp. TaxID=253161 RepID=UPI00260B7AE1|nr:hypothetical protein [uncultured Methanobrevibacter sp.]